MKSLARLVKTLVVLLIVLIVFALIARNHIVKYGAPLAARLVAGLKLSIDKVDIGLPRTDAGLQGITLHNPAGFPDTPMLSVSEVYVDYSPAGLLGDTVHLEQLRLHVDRIVIVRNKDGKLNVKELLPPSKAKPGTPGEPGPPGQPSGPPKFRIDALSLKIGDVVYQDYTAGDPPREMVYTLNIDEQHTDVTSAGGIASLIVGKALMNSALAGLSGVDIKAFTDLAGSALGGVGTTLKQVHDAAAAVQALSTNKAVKDAGDALRTLF
jgi:uncharacterized protein involved in outer membrane biogenesis